MAFKIPKINSSLTYILSTSFYSLAQCVFLLASKSILPQGLICAKQTGLRVLHAQNIDYHWLVG